MEAAIVLGVIFGFIVMLVKVDARKKERMFLMKQGKDPNLVDSKNDTFSSVNYLKWGIIVASIGLGMLMGTIIGSLYSSKQYDSLYLACLLIFAGIGIVVSFLVTHRNVSSGKSAEEQKST
jgi:hypothetical protein